MVRAFRTYHEILSKYWLVLVKGVLRALRSNWRGVGDEDGKVDGEQIVKYLYAVKRW